MNAPWCDDITAHVLGLPRYIARVKPHSKRARTQRPSAPQDLDAWHNERAQCLQVDAWSLHTEHTREVARALGDLPDIHAALSRVDLGEPLRDVDLFALKRALLSAHTALEHVPLLPQEGDIERIEQTLDTIHPEPRRTARFSLVDAHDPAFGAARRAHKKARRAWGEARETLEDDLTETWGPLHFDLHGVSRDARLANEPRAEAVAGGWRAFSPELTRLEEEHQHAQETVDAVASQVRANLTRALRASTSWMRALENRLIDFDLRWARARLRQDIQGCWPNIAPTLTLTEGADPRIQAPQPITFSASERPALIVGPNMGGKSSLLKLVGLCQWCLHHVWPAPAASFAAPHAQGLVYVGADEPRQDLASEGLSAFGHEIRRVVEVVETTTSPRLWLLDEFGRGTHPEEGAALGQRLIERLVARGDRVCASTHFAALANLPNTDLWRVRGLHNIPETPPTEDILATLRAHMDYRVFPVHEDKNIPRDAFIVASWLNFDAV